MQLQFFRNIFEKYANINILANPFSGSRVVPCGQTDRQRDRLDEIKSRFWQFCERI